MIRVSSISKTTKDKLKKIDALVEEIRALIPISSSKCRECGLNVQSNWTRTKVHQLLSGIRYKTEKIGNLADYRGGWNLNQTTSSHKVGDPQWQKANAN